MILKVVAIQPKTLKVVAIFTVILRVVAGLPVFLKVVAIQAVILKVVIIQPVIVKVVVILQVFFLYISGYPVSDCKNDQKGTLVVTLQVADNDIPVATLPGI